MFKYQINEYTAMNHQNNLLVFDLGNTLYPSSLQFQAMREAMGLHRLQKVNYNELYDHFCKIFPFVGGALDLSFVSAILRSIKPVPEVDSITLLADYRQSLYILIKQYILTDPNGTWKYLSDMSLDHHLGILSNNNKATKELWLEILKETGHDFFDFFIVSEEVRVSKPNMRMFFEIKRQLDPSIKFDNIYFFGDNLIRDGASAFYDMTFVHVNGFTIPSIQKRQPYRPDRPLLSIDFINHDSLLSLYYSNDSFSNIESTMVNSLSE
ncbi:MAG: HAD family hydrolase [Candidatus Heimdallarchaeota archaeon]|nr:HAD family hydrolase [Candidatus Heimdallarchaeota archaeon]